MIWLGRNCEHENSQEHLSPSVMVEGKIVNETTWKELLDTYIFSPSNEIPTNSSHVVSNQQIILAGYPGGPCML